MARIFRDNHISAAGNVLPLRDFKLFCDIEKPKLNKAKMERIIASAEKHLTEDIPFLPLSIYREFYLTGNRGNYETPYFARRNMALTLSIAEAYEKKGRFTDKLADVIWAILEESSWIIPAHTTHSPTLPGTDVPEVFNRDRIHGIDLFSATTSAMLATVYYYSKDILDEISPFICERVAYELKERAIKPFVSCSFGWSGIYGNRPNNWCPWICSNILTTTAIIEEDPRIRTRVVQKAMDFVDNFTAFYEDDGGCDEGPGYWTHAGGSMFDCLEIIEDMTGGKIKNYNDPLVRAIGEYEAKMNIHADRFVNFADCSGKFLADGPLLMRYGEKCGSEALISFGVDMASRNAFHVNPSAPYRSVKNLMTPMTRKKPKAAALRKTYMSGLKVMITRESSDSSKGFFFAMKGGHNAESHNHNDLGSFIVYYDGAPVLIDVGVGHYTKQTFSDRRYEIWFMQSNYHNLPTFDGIGEMQGREYVSKDECYDEEKGSLTLQLKDAFTKDVGIESFTRCGMINNGKISVTDSISLDREREIDFHFMTNEKPEILSECVISLPAGRRLVFDSALTPEIEEFGADGMDSKGAWGSVNLWRIHLRIRAKSYTGEFIIE